MIQFIEKYCVVPEGMNVGQPLVLEPFQRRFILEVYDNPAGTKKGILSIARKNAKTATIACIVLGHLVGPESKKNSQIQSGAQSREQAAAVFDLCVKMINLNPELGSIVRISAKRLLGLPLNVEYRALAAESKTAHGGSPILAVLDEVGQVRGTKNDFIDAIVTSQGAHEDPLLLVISTQAPTDADLLSVWIDDAKTGGDPHTVCHVHEAPEGCELTDPEAWKAANPALGKFRSLADIRSLAEQATRMPSFANTFRNLYLNQRVSVTSPFVSRDSWKACSGEPLPLSECDEVYCGLDLSAKIDLTAAVFVGLKDGLHHVHPYFWTPSVGLYERSRRDRVPYDVWSEQGFLRTTPGATVDYEHVAHELATISSGINLIALAYDRWHMPVLKKELERIGVDLPLVEWGQGFKDMAPALDAAESSILNVLLRHGGHPVLTMCASNSTVVKNPGGDRKLDRMRATGRIDGMVALAMAEGVAQRNDEGAGAFDDFVEAPLIM